MLAHHLRRWPSVKPDSGQRVRVCWVNATLLTLDTAPSHVKMCRWLTSYLPPLSISSIVVSLWLAGCLAKSTLIGWREYYGGGGVGVDRHLCEAQQTRAFAPMLFQYLPTANGAGPTLKQHWVESSCLLGELSAFWYTRAVCVWSEQAAQCSV